MHESVITQQVMENLVASSSQQPPEELVQEVNALEAERANLEATLACMGLVDDPRPRPIDPEVSRQKVLILDLNGLLLRTCKGKEKELPGPLCQRGPRSSATFLCLLTHPVLFTFHELEFLAFWRQWQASSR
ncbi:hypothetical protein R1flu_006934 [Riccia fluitans]|uniref:FCP1 homology domain-containing protein n=1 Tax=Riccia fluitans TaxID=41844 RepID=A0ABD1YYA0_9MARC